MIAWRSLCGWIQAIPQYIAPQHTLSRWMRRLAASERPWLARALIRGLSWRYPIDLHDARESDPSRYASLNAFFTRALREDARLLPAEPSALASPADGLLSQVGRLTGAQLLQAKGRWYSVAKLLVLDDETGGPFRDGHFATIYLAPHNYHRVHCPCDCAIEEVIYVPGDLFSVNTRTAATVPDLFARNERVVLHCRSSHGAFAIVLVGAMLVGSITLECCDLRPLYARRALGRLKLAPGTSVARGAELGRFNMGSTVILVFARDLIEWTSAMDSEVRMGQPIGHWLA